MTTLDQTLSPNNEASLLPQMEQLPKEPPQESQSDAHAQPIMPPIS